MPVSLLPLLRGPRLIYSIPKLFLSIIGEDFFSHVEENGQLVYCSIKEYEVLLFIFSF